MVAPGRPAPGSSAPGSSAPGSSAPGSSAPRRGGGKTSAKLQRFGRFIFLSTITFVGLLNLQPWFAVAKEMKKAITFVPFLSSLTQLPGIGGWIVWLSNQENALSAIALGLWALTQFCEMTDIDWIKKKRPLVYAWEFAVIFIHFPPYEGGYTALVEDFPYWNPDQILWWNLIFSVVCAFAFEFIYNILKKNT